MTEELTIHWDQRPLLTNQPAQASPHHKMVPPLQFVRLGFYLLIYSLALSYESLKPCTLTSLTLYSGLHINVHNYWPHSAIHSSLWHPLTIHMRHLGVLESLSFSFSLYLKAVIIWPADPPISSEESSAASFFTMPTLSLLSGWCAPSIAEENMRGHNYAYTLYTF